MRNMIENVVKNMIENMIENMMRNIVRNMMKNMIENMIESLIKSLIKSLVTLLENLIKNLIESRSAIEFKSTHQVDWVESKVWLNLIELSWSLSTQLNTETQSELSWATWTWRQIYSQAKWAKWVTCSSCSLWSLLIQVIRVITLKFWLFNDYLIICKRVLILCLLLLIWLFTSFYLLWCMNWMRLSEISMTLQCHWHSLEKMKERTFLAISWFFSWTSLSYDWCCFASVMKIEKAF